jgi:hypothetical protein
MRRTVMVCLAGFAAAAGPTAAFADEQPLRIYITPGQSLQEAMRDSLLAERAAALRANWAARTAEPAPATTYAMPSITKGTLVTKTLSVQAPLPSPVLALTFETDTPGLSSVYYSFTSPVGNLYLTNTYTSPLPTTKGTLTLQAHNTAFGLLGGYAPPGTWTLTYVDICDTAGDCQYYQPPQLATLFNRVTFTVTNPGTADTTPPAIVSGKILTPKVKLSAANPIFLAEFKVTDTISGVAYAQVFIMPPGSNSSFADDYATPQPVLNGNVVAGTTLETTSPTGTWTIYGYGACDVAGNCFSDFTAADVLTVFGKNSFVVTQ